MKIIVGSIGYPFVRRKFFAGRTLCNYLNDKEFFIKKEGRVNPIREYQI